MVSLESRMNDMKPYFRGIEMYNDAIMVKVSFPNNWKVYPSDDERIKTTKSDDGLLTYYYADSNNTSYDEMFDLIEGTIKSNQDIILKLKLLKDKVEELKELFSNSTYEELLGLEFVLNKQQKPKKTKKATNRKKSKNSEDEKAAEEPVNNNSEEKVG